MLIDMFFSFTGRVSRKQFILRFLMLSILFIIVLMVSKIAILEGIGTLQYFVTAMTIIIGISQISLFIRRSHDLNYLWGYTAVIVILGLLPLTNIIAILLLSCTKGTDGINFYGIDPLEKEINNPLKQKGKTDA